MSASQKNRIQKIITRATPLWDRPGRLVGHRSPSRRQEARARWDRWRMIFGAEDALERRLCAVGCSSDEMKNRLCGQWNHDKRSKPLWARTLEAVSSLTSSLSGSHNEVFNDPVYDSDRPLPFQEVLVGFLRYARESFKVPTDSAMNVLSPLALKRLEHGLLSHLTFLASLAIGQDFYEFRFKHSPASAMEKAWSEQERTKDIYISFVRHMLDGGLDALFEKYPVLARLLCQSLDQWTTASARFCRRFATDFEELRVLFNWELDSPEGAIEDLRTNLSDRHQGGQTVLDCLVRTEQRVVYKPRTVLPEIQFYRFINWINGCHLSLDLKELRALDKSTHGWVQFVPFMPCRSKREMEEFYARAGMLLAVLYVLGVTDIHYQNIIANGHHPVIVDLETLLCGGGGLGETNGRNDLRDGASVLSTGLLPRWHESSDRRQYDASGLGADTTQPADIEVPMWEAINSDQMRLSKVAHLAQPMIHRPRLGGAVPSPLNYLVNLQAGFEEMYSCLLSHRERMLFDDCLLNGFEGLELRVLVRNTTTYARMHVYLLHPEFLMDGIDRSIELDWLARPLSARARPQMARIQLYEFERNAMENADIPHFGISMWRELENVSQGQDVLLPQGKRDVTVLKEHLARLSPEDCAKQLASIESALRSRFDSDYQGPQEPRKIRLVNISIAN